MKDIGVAGSQPITGPWGSVAAERWVLVRAEVSSPSLWDVSGCVRAADQLPISRGLQERIERWCDWYDALDAQNKSFPEPMYWEQRDDMPLADFNAEGRAIGRALKAELLDDWTVEVEDVDAWCRPREDDRLILPGADWACPGQAD